MDQVRLYLEGIEQPRLVDMETYMRIRAQHPTLARRIECPDCGGRATAHVPKKTGITSHAGEEVTKTAGERAKKFPPFTHETASPVCPQKLARNSRYKELYAKNNFDPRVREKNIRVLNKNGMQRALRDIQAFHLFSLLNRPEISSEIQTALNMVPKKLLNLEGLDQHPWLLGYALLFAELPRGTLIRNFRDGPYSAEYTIVRYQSLPITRLDGTQGALVVPHFYRPTFMKIKNGKIFPERAKAKQSAREMSHDIARGIAERARDNRRAGKADDGPAISETQAPLAPCSLDRQQPFRPLEDPVASAYESITTIESWWLRHD